MANSKNIQNFNEHPERYSRLEVEIVEDAPRPIREAYFAGKTIPLRYLKKMNIVQAKLVEMCQFMRIGSDKWELGYSLDGGDIIIGVLGDQVPKESISDFEARPVQAPQGKFFTIEPVKRGISITLK